MNDLVKDDATLRSQVFTAGQSAIKIYSPYSNFKVAAVIISESIRFIKDNIENASYASTFVLRFQQLLKWLVVASSLLNSFTSFLILNSLDALRESRQCIRELKNDIPVFLVNSLSKVREHSPKELLHSFSFEPEHQSE